MKKIIMSSKENRDVTLLTTVMLLAMDRITELTMSHVPDIIKLMNKVRDETNMQKNGIFNVHRREAIAGVVL